jgi:hypothetical protein
MLGYSTITLLWFGYKVSPPPQKTRVLGIWSLAGGAIFDALETLGCGT